jgi:two-component system NarL family sensor kinase
MARREGAVVGSPRGALTAFLLVAVLALVVVSAGAAVISQRIARASALAEAQRSTERMAEFLVAPILDDALDGVPGRW